MYVSLLFNMLMRVVILSEFLVLCFFMFRYSKCRSFE